MKMYVDVDQATIEHFVNPIKYAHSFVLLSFVVGKTTYHKVSNIRRTLEGNKIVDHSDVVGASPVGAAPTTSSFST